MAIPRVLRRLPAVLFASTLAVVATVAGSPAQAAGTPAPERLTVYVFPGGSGMGLVGPDHKHHDTFMPSNFVLHKGVPVTFTVVNYDDMNHSISSSALGFNIVAKPGVDRKDGSVAPTATTVTFTPEKAGTFRWHCVFPCDMPRHWAMSSGYDGPGQDGFMAGWIKVM